MSIYKVNKVKIVFKKVKAAGFKINAEKLHFGKDNLEYLGFKITRQGIMPLPDKVQAIKDIAVPTNKKQLTSFIGGEYLITIEICRNTDRIF